MQTDQNAANISRSGKKVTFRRSEERSEGWRLGESERSLERFESSKRGRR